MCLDPFPSALSCIPQCFLSIPQELLLPTFRLFRLAEAYKATWTTFGALDRERSGKVLLREQRVGCCRDPERVRLSCEPLEQDCYQDW